MVNVGDRQVHLLPAGRPRTSPHRLLGNGSWSSLVQHSQHLPLRDRGHSARAGGQRIAGAGPRHDASLVCGMRTFSRADQVQKATERLVAAGSHVVGAVLNGVPTPIYARRYGEYPFRLRIMARPMAAHIRSSRPSGILRAGSGDSFCRAARAAGEQDAGPVRGGVGRGRRATRGLLRVPLLAGSLLALTVAAVGLYFLHDFQVERMADSVRRRAESLAAAGQFGPSADYFHRYLQLHPTTPPHASAWPKRSTNPPPTLGGRSSPMKRRWAWPTRAFPPSASSRSASGWWNCASPAGRWPPPKAGQAARGSGKATGVRAQPRSMAHAGLKALVLYRQFRSQSKGVRPSSVEQAFQRVLEPAAGEPQVYRDPRVLLARYEYRLQQRKPAARDDLEAALRAAPRNVDVLFGGGRRRKREAVAALRRQGPGGQTKALFSEGAATTAAPRKATPPIPEVISALGNCMPRQATCRAPSKPGKPA